MSNDRREEAIKILREGGYQPPRTNDGNTKTGHQAQRISIFRGELPAPPIEAIARCATATECFSLWGFIHSAWSRLAWTHEFINGSLSDSMHKKFEKETFKARQELEQALKTATAEGGKYQGKMHPVEDLEMMQRVLAEAVLHSEEMKKDIYNKSDAMHKIDSELLSDFIVVLRIARKQLLGIDLGRKGDLHRVLERNHADWFGKQLQEAVSKSTDKFLAPERKEEDNSSPSKPENS